METIDGRKTIQRSRNHASFYFIPPLVWTSLVLVNGNAGCCSPLAVVVVVSSSWAVSSRWICGQRTCDLRTGQPHSILFGLIRINSTKFSRLQQKRTKHDRQRYKLRSTRAIRDNAFAAKMVSTLCVGRPKQRRAEHYTCFTPSAIVVRCRPPRASDPSVCPSVLR